MTPQGTRDAKKLAYLAFHMKGSVVDRIQGAVKDAFSDGARALLAVSGGIDSMVLLHAAQAACGSSQLVVATFDHASGPHAAAAVDLVERTAMGAGLPVVIGRGSARERPSEAAWRDD